MVFNKLNWLKTKNSKWEKKSSKKSWLIIEIYLNYKILI